MSMKWAFLFWATSVFALPQNPIVVSQDAQIDIRSPEVMEIAAQNGTTIEWSDFSIEAPETVRFSQPSVEAVVLNRVVGSEISQILGKLEANGKILLINPNGVLFGKESVIDTESFVASTLDLQNDLVAKNKAFKGASTAQIINLGSLNARGGEIALIASDIHQQGSIHAQNGTVALIGSTYTKDFECQFPDETISRINLSGSIEAPGGRVHLMADEIFVFGTSEITTSSPFSGGEILIGAGQQGKDPAFTNAQLIWVDEGAQLLADSWEQGNGGEVILFSDRVTDFAGHISAQGGKWGGDGGFAEVSGELLAYKGLADLRSTYGETGTLLLDPLDLSITTGVTTIVPTGACPGVGFTYTAGAGACIAGCPACVAGGSVLNNATLTANLATCNVTVTTIGTVGGCPGDVFVGAPIPDVGVLTSAFSLTISAANDIFINADIRNTGTGAITLIACRDVNINAVTPTLQGADVGSMGGPTTVTAGRDIRLIGPNAPLVNTTAQIGWRAAAAGDVATGSVTANAGQDILLNDGSSTGGGAIIGHFSPFFVGGVSFTVTNANVTVNAVRDITLTTHDGAFKGCLIGHGYIGIVTFTASGMISVNCGGNLTFQEAPPTAPAFGSHAIIGFHPFQSNTGIATFSGNVIVNVGGNFAIIPTGADVFETFGIGTSLFAAAGVSMDTVPVQVNVGGSIAMPTSPTFGQRSYIGKLCFNLGGPGPVISGDVTVNSGGPISLNGLGGTQFCFIGYGIDVTTSTGNGNVFVRAGGDIDLRATAGSAFIPTFIGLILPATAPTLRTGNTRVSSAGTINMNTFGPNTRCGINAPDDVFVQALGNINANGNIFVGTEHPNLARTTRILAGGNILGTPPAIFGNGYLATFVVPPATHTNFLVMNAGGNIQMPNSFVTTNPGSISIAASTPIPGFNFFVPPFNSGVIPVPGCGTSFVVTRPAFAIAGSAIPCGVNGCLSFFLTNPPLLLQTTSGPITLHSGPQAFGGGFCNLRIGNQFGDDVTIATTSGNIEVFGSAACSAPCARANAFYDVTINQNICTTGSVLIAANHNLAMEPNSSIGGPACGALIPSSVTLIVDNQFPLSPSIGPGAFFMDASAVINSTGPIQIYTALQNFNAINGTINGVFPFVPGTPFVDTCSEQWCTYYCASLPTTCGSPTIPFTIAYKNCLPPIVRQATIIVSEFFIDLHPYNEFPGWMMRFWFDYALGKGEYPIAAKPYMLCRRQLKVINHPKTWTHLVPDTHPRPKAP